MNFVWRVAIIFFLALPILLSVGYKRFINGSATISLNSTQLTSLVPHYGLFPTSNEYHPWEDKSGLSIYFNATIPFKLASSVLKDSAHITCPSKSGNCIYTNIEPTLPEFPQAYGANVLVLNDSTSVMLDMPSGDRLKKLQDSLSIDESLTIETNVHGTMARWNNSTTVANDPLFKANSNNTHWHCDTIDLFQYVRLGIFYPFDPGDQSHVWVGILPIPKSGWDPSLKYFALHAKRYDISRQKCHAYWSLTKGGIGLLDGSCADVLPGKRSQTVLTENQFILGVTWLGTMADSLSMFAGTRNASVWLGPSMNTFVAGMCWAAATGTVSLRQQANLTTDRDFHDRGLFYEVDELVTSTRISLEKSQWLYFVLIIQPLLMIMAMIAIYFLHSVPIERDFGIVSILAGVDRETLGLLYGASLSGKLKEDVQLSITPVTKGTRTVLHYRFGLKGGVSNGRVDHSTTYF